VFLADGLRDGRRIVDGGSRHREPLRCFVSPVPAVQFERNPAMTHVKAEPGRLVLDEPLTMRAAEALQTRLREMIDRHSVVEIDCSAATEIDLSFVQLLLAARLSAQKAGKTVNIAALPAGALLDILTRGGFRPTREARPDGGTGFWFGGATRP
jgi:ABC-type transporter Mla MlaB component